MGYEGSRARRVVARVAQERIILLIGYIVRITQQIAFTEFVHVVHIIRFVHVFTLFTIIIVSTHGGGGLVVDIALDTLIDILIGIALDEVLDIERLP